MGTIRLRHDGRYEARIMVNGRRKSLYGPSEAAVQAKLAALQHLLAEGRTPPSGLTLRQLAQRWLATEARHWKPRTLADYQRVLGQYVFPSLGGVRLTHLTPDRLQQVLDSIPGRAASQTARVLHRLFAVAVRWGYLSENPCDRLVLPRYQPPRPALPALDDLKRLLGVCLTSHDPGAPLVGVLLLTGLRLGEALALRWDAVDLDRALVRVERSGQWLRGQWVETTPKTVNGHRCIPLGDLGVQLLKRQRALVAERRLRAGPAWQDWGLVFPSQTGKPQQESVVLAAVRRCCQQAGIPRLTVHQLRHAHASLALAAGVPLPDVSRRLGHATPAITSGIYSHAVSDGHRVARAVEQALLS